MGLTHTDLKPENILLKLDSKKRETDMEELPVNVTGKREMYDGEKVESESDNEMAGFSDEEDLGQDGCTGGDIQPTKEELMKRRSRFSKQITWLRPLDD